MVKKIKSSKLINKDINKIIRTFQVMLTNLEKSEKSISESKLKIENKIDLLQNEHVSLEQVQKRTENLKSKIMNLIN